MLIRWTLFASILLVALSLMPAGAHLLALPNKIDMNAADYLASQQAYRGWAYVGVFVVLALVATAALAWTARESSAAFVPALVALACLAATQVVFWTLNFPANRVTHNWGTLPENWEALRLRWETGHAVSALLTLVALVALLSVLVRGGSPAGDPLSSR